ncbi:MAG: hypothetical protein JW874_08615 [Spirochaetales bacterium]|nr:hypothetical protein [Spirochaetales bacterium]
MKKLFLLLLLVPMLLSAEEKSAEEQLFLAVRAQNITTASQLLKKGVSPDIWIMTYYSKNNGEVFGKSFTDNEIQKTALADNCELYDLSDEVLKTENIELIQLFVRSKCRFDRINDIVLYQLIKDNRKDIFDILFDSGFDVNITVRNRTLAEMAEFKKNSNMAAYFRGKSGKTDEIPAMSDSGGEWINPFGIKVANLPARLVKTADKMLFFEELDPSEKPVFTCTANAFWNNGEKTVYRVFSVYPDKTEHTWIIKQDQGKDILYLFYAGRGKLPDVRGLDYSKLVYIPYYRSTGKKSASAWLNGTWLLPGKTMNMETLVLLKDGRGSFKNAQNTPGFDFDFTWELVWEYPDNGMCLCIFNYGPGNVWYMTIVPDKGRSTFEWNTFGQNALAFAPDVQSNSPFYGKKVKQ